MQMGKWGPREKKGLTSVNYHPLSYLYAFHPLGKDTVLTLSLTFRLAYVAPN